MIFPEVIITPQQVERVTDAQILERRRDLSTAAGYPPLLPGRVVEALWPEIGSKDALLLESARVVLQVRLGVLVRQDLGDWVRAINETLETFNHLQAVYASVPNVVPTSDISRLFMVLDHAVLAGVPGQRDDALIGAAQDILERVLLGTRFSRAEALTLSVHPRPLLARAGTASLQAHRE